MEGCLSENAVVTLLAGRLPAQDLAGVEAHLDSCRDCRELLAHAARNRSTSAPSTAISTVISAARAPGAADGATTEPPIRIGRYEVLRVVGAGGMGAVYAARDPDLDRVVALKLVRPSGADSAAAQRARLAREAHAMARLAHPNVVTVHEVGEHEDQLYIAMELVEGGTLADRLRAPRPPGWREVAALLSAAGRGLVAAHAAGIIHRDFKPANVLVGSDGRVRVTDFGLAQLGLGAGPAEPSPSGGDPAQLGVSSAIRGTPAYMAPEQFRGEPADARADQFSFCATFWEALYGRRPFDGRTLEELQASVCRGALPPRPRTPAVPAALHRAITRGLQAAPADRWPSMAALLEAVDAAARPRRPLVLVLGSLAAAAAAAVAALALHRPARWQAAIQDLPVYEENADTPVFSPDGTMIAYPSDRDQPGIPRIYISPLHGGTPRAVTPPGLTALYPRWAGDGRALLFVDAQKDRAYRVATTGGEPELVAEQAKQIEDCGGRLLILHDNGPGCEQCQRLVLRAPGGSEREIFRATHAEVLHFPRCDRAGRRVLYSMADRDLGGTVGYNAYDLWILDVDGDAPRQLTRDAAGNVGTFTPDGHSIVFSASHEGQQHLFELALDGDARPVQLTFGAGFESVPDVSPDGRLVIFDIDITSTQLFAQPMAGGAARKLTANVQGLDAPKPTPDGRALVAQSVSLSGATQIVRIPLDGGEPVPLADGHTPQLTLDGDEVVYTVAMTGRVFATPVTGGPARLVTEAPAPVYGLAVGGDGRVHLVILRAENYEAWSAPLAGGAAERELPAPWTQLVPAPRGGWRVALRPNPFRCRFLPPGAALGDPGARDLAADHEGAWTADGASWLFVRDSRVHRFFVETGEDRVVSEPADYGGIAASRDGETLYSSQTVGRVRRALITNFADRR